MITLHLAVKYSDGVVAEGFERTKRLFIIDDEIMTATYGLFMKTANRRIRIKSIGFCFEYLTLLSYQPDLFEPETEIKNRNSQIAVDKIQNRYGSGKITKGTVLAAKAIITAASRVEPSPQSGSVEYTMLPKAECRGGDGVEVCGVRVRM